MLPKRLTAASSASSAGSAVGDAFRIAQRPVRLYLHFNHMQNLSY